jgi:hypothetical protein
LIVVVLCILALFGIWTLFLGLGARWAKVPKVTPGRIIATTALVWLAGIAVLLAVKAAADAIPASDPRARDREVVRARLAGEEPAPDPRELIVEGARLAAMVLVTLVAIRATLTTGLRQTAQVWLVSLAGGLANTAILFLDRQLSVGCA